MLRSCPACIIRQEGDMLTIIKHDSEGKARVLIVFVMPFPVGPLLD
jgi:hypothetical protein